jgi:cell division initiation protein
MDSAKSSQQSSLDSLRTVEFRQTLRGYHIDDVDEYLERVAVEAEALQEQLRQANERVRQAADRIAHLEKAVEESSAARPAPAPAPAAAQGEDHEVLTDDTLQRTLLLAQKFVDQTKAEAEAAARSTVSKAEEHARNMLTEAEARARAVTADTERKLREEVGRLEGLRTKLNEDVEKMSHHLESERTRLRSALGDMLTWIDKNLQGSQPARGEGNEDRAGASQEPRVPPGANGPQGQMMPEREKAAVQASAHNSGLH